MVVIIMEARKGKRLTIMKLKKSSGELSTFIKYWFGHPWSKPMLTIMVLILILGGGVIIYQDESSNPLKGRADFQLSYRFRLTNRGPLNLTFLSVRLALLKTWNPVQVVHSLIIESPPNRTTTDEYDNLFAWYEFDSFGVNQSLDLVFRANLTLNLLDYSTMNLNYDPNYDTNSPLYKLYTAYNPYADPTDPLVRQVAQTLSQQSRDPLDLAFQAYNFSSTYIKYRLLSSIRGASFALRNGYGDCDEYNTLFIALLRANGIPAIGHTAWLADFAPGFETTDDGAVSHAYPMFYLRGVGLLPADPTRGAKKLFDNWLKTDEKRITLTRGPDHPYRLLKYRWIPDKNLPDPTVDSNYTITIQNMNVEYFSLLRTAVIVSIIGTPILFVITRLVQLQKYKKKQKRELERLLSPENST